MSTVLPDLHKIAENAAISSIDQAIPKLFSRKLTAPDGRLTNDEMNTHFPDFGERVPQSVFGSWKRRFATTLIAESRAWVGSKERGVVYIWQCKK
jgi:hypothetical protein